MIYNLKMKCWICYTYLNKLCSEFCQQALRTYRLGAHIPMYGGPFRVGKGEVPINPENYCGDLALIAKDRLLKEFPQLNYVVASPIGRMP